MNLFRINNNLNAYYARRQIEKEEIQLQRAFKRLSAGLRILQAADDAAGLAVSSGMTSQINGIQQARRNVEDGKSLLQTAEGALENITDMLNRGRTLAIQAANDTLTQTDREAIQKDLDQINEELNRISSTANFNGKKILTEAVESNTSILTSQSDFSSGTVPAQIDINSVPGEIRLNTEAYGIDAHHANVGLENYISVAKIAVNPNGDQYDVTLELRFSDNAATGGATTFDGAITINNANITAVGALGGNEGGGGLLQAGNTVNFNITENGASGNESVFTIDFTTTSLDASFDLQLNSPIDRGVNRYFNNSLIQGGIPPGTVNQRFEPLSTTGTYTSEAIDLGSDNRLRIEFDTTTPNGTSIRYFVQTADDPGGAWSAPQAIANGTEFQVTQRYIRVLTELNTPAALAENGIGPSVLEIRVLPLRNNEFIIHSGANKDQTINLDLPDTSAYSLGVSDVDVTTRKGDVLYSTTLSSQNDFETGTIVNLNTLFTPGALELNTEPFGTEVPPANNGLERLVSVNRQSSVANPNGTVTTTVRIVSASDSTVPYDNPPPNPGFASTEYIGRFRVIGGTLNDTDGDGIADSDTVVPISLEGYDPGGDGIPPFFHGDPGNYADDLINASPGSTVDADQFVDFRFRTGGLQDGFEITLSGLPNMSFELDMTNVRSFSTGPFTYQGDASYNVHFGDATILATPTGAATIQQAFEERQAVGTFTSAPIDMGQGGLNRISYNANTPGATSVTVEYATSSDGVIFGAFQAISQGGTFTSAEDQRYVQLRVTLNGDPGDNYISPQLNDITVDRLASEDGPTNAIELYSSAIDEIVGERAQIGAEENRLSAADSSLSVMNISTLSARSRILDLDYGEEIVEFSKANILRQAAAAALSQANVSPQIVLQLLK